MPRLWSAAPFLLRGANVLIRELLAPGCAACGAQLDEPLSSPVCAACWAAVSGTTPPWCAVCGEPLASPTRALCARCGATPPRYTSARSGARYEGALRPIIHAFKYGGARVLAEPLAAMMRGAGAPLLENADAVVPVPLHPWRRLRRGFNQADDLARGLGLPVRRVLRRRRHGPPQSTLPADRRDRNVREAFALAAPSAWSRRTVRGRVLVLVDDVMTTGATLDACAGVLLDAGAKRVHAVTAARAAAPLPTRWRLPPDLSTARRR